MRRFRLLAAAAAIAAMSITTAAAQGKSGNAPKGGPTKVSSPAHGKAGGKKAGGPKNDGAKNDGARNDAAPKDKTAKGTAPGKGSDDKPENKPENRPDKKPDSTATTAPASNIASKIAKNPQQLARVTALLPAGMTLEQASAGFRNQGQFLAALNASKNQGVSFAALQTAMTEEGASLGQAVKRLRPATSTN